MDRLRRAGQSARGFGAIKSAGYDGADLPGDLQRVDPKTLKPIADSLGLQVPEVLGAWAYFHAGENRDLAGLDEAARRTGIDYATRAIDLAAELGAQYFQVCAAQPRSRRFHFRRRPYRLCGKTSLRLAVKSARTPPGAASRCCSSR